MHLITFDDGNGERIGLLEGVGGDVVDLPAVDPELPRAMLGLIELGEAGLRRVRAAWEAAGPDPRRYHRDRYAPGVGVAFDPPRYLRAGDRVAVHVDGIGALTNPVT